MGDTVHATAPGRVNLIGEHTDYNGGFVLPTAIPQRTRVALARRDDRAGASALRERVARRDLRAGGRAAAGTWADYVQGITWAVPRRGSTLGGFELDVQSDVPLGGGLSSSASLEVALLRALREAFELDLDDVRLARLGQTAENDFVGARCGIMDQMAATLADSDAALFLDTRSLEYRRVPLPSTADLVVCTRVSHTGSPAASTTRAAPSARPRPPSWGCPAARSDLGRSPREWRSCPRGWRGAPGTSSPRTNACWRRSTRSRPATWTIGRLFYASHASMRDDFEVSTPEIDLLVELARGDADIFGARLTGGGFGGAVVMLARPARAAALANASRMSTRREPRARRRLVPLAPA